ncbi:uncharacterized protein LOC119458614 [Dermacentor silvarum]|uniref:uncharacterized protein LOC119458614 n=1 Tax=Dermacentor silvarum TaxID=543639 RepID=UPI0021013699|nr:uncharacterized protein LOC119458614 [Dermacentor silvarum]
MEGRKEQTKARRKSRNNCCVGGLFKHVRERERENVLRFSRAAPRARAPRAVDRCCSPPKCRRQPLEAYEAQPRLQRSFCQRQKIESSQESSIPAHHISQRLQVHQEGRRQKVTTTAAVGREWTCPVVVPMRTQRQQLRSGDSAQQRGNAD